MSNTPLTDQLSSKDFPVYFHDIVNKGGAICKGKKLPVFRTLKGKIVTTSFPSNLELEFWLTHENTSPRVNYQTFRKL